MSADDLTVVLAFVEQYGVPIFPLRPNDKTPLTDHGFKDASRDPAQVDKWAKQHPGCNWGMPTGAASGFAVLDIDMKNGKDGEQSLRRLIDSHGPLPETAEVLTPSGGRHLYFRTNGAALRSTAGVLGDGLDVRADGGYVAIPTSRINGRAYEWEASSDPAEVGFAELPAWLAELAKEKPRSVRTENTEGAIPEGGRNAHLTSLAGTMRRRGMTPEAITAALMAENSQRCNPPLGDEEIRRIAESVGRYAPAENTTTDAWPPALDLIELAARTPISPQFVADDWLPVGYASLLAGHGGAGKSNIALTFAVCLAAELPFFSVPVRRRRVMYLSCEDREDVLHWRLTRLCAYLRIDLASLAGWLDIVGLVGRDSVLWERDPRTGYTVTPAYNRLAERMLAPGAEVLIVDGVTDTFGGAENARSEVKRYINALLALVPADTGALLLLHHVDKVTAKGTTTSEGYSGSTAWHNSVRARWYLYPETTAADDNERAQRTGRLLLELQKSNLGRADQQMIFKWDDDYHLFIGETVTDFDREHQAREERRGILRALKACADAGIPVPAATTGRRTAYHVVAAQSAFPETLRAGKPATRRFWREIEALRAMGHVRDESIKRKDRHYVATLTLSAEGMRACGQ